MIHTCKPLIFVLGVLVLFIFKSSDTIACTADACKHVHCDAPVSCPPHQTFACTECCCCLVCVPSIPKGGECNYDILPPTAACTPGTQCVDGICKCIMEY